MVEKASICPAASEEQDGVFPAALAGLRTAGWEAAEAVRSEAGTLQPSASG